MLANIYLNTHDGKVAAMYYKNPDPIAPGVVISIPKDDDSAVNSELVRMIKDVFIECGFSVLIINYRLKGESKELEPLIKDSVRSIYDISFALDWMKSNNKDMPYFAMVGVDKSCVHVANVVMRRPEVEYMILFNPFITKNPDYSFLSPTPCAGIVFSDKNVSRSIAELETVNFVESLNEDCLFKIFFKSYDSRKKDYIDVLKQECLRLINEEEASKVKKMIKKKRRKRSKTKNFTY